MFYDYVNLLPFHLSYVIHMQRRWFQALKDVNVSFIVPGYVIRHGHAKIQHGRATSKCAQSKEFGLKHGRATFEHGRATWLNHHSLK